MTSSFRAIAIGAMLLAIPAHALPEPRIKPPNAEAANRVLQGAEFTAFKSALAAGDVGDWRTQTRQSQLVKDATAQNVLAWQRALGDTQVDWPTLSHVVTTLGDWPRMTAIQAKAERRLLDDAPLSASEIVVWFAGREPVSGEGRIALADALYATGQPDRALQYLKLAWRDARLTRDLQRDVFSRHGSKLSAADHAARVDHLIWQGTSQYAKAKALLPYISEGERALHTARMALRERRPNVTALINAVPADLRDSPELNFERARWRRQRLKDRDSALEALLGVDAPVTDEDGRDDVWREKRLMIYWLIGEGRYDEAYTLTENNGLKSGLGFQEAEFLGGWLALSRLGQPDVAETRFRTLYNGVSRSVSKARGAYWTARALEAQGKDAKPFYDAASAFQNTYYGQLGSVKAGRGEIALPPDPADPGITDARLKAIKLLGEAGELGLVETFSFRADDDLATLPELSSLARVAAQQGSLKASVRASKQAARFGQMLTETGYPMPLSIVTLDRNRFDIPFTLAIARQESEFDPGAVSSARAYGLMQMIDSTARATARKHGLRYDRGRMLADESYAARMGSLHLNDLLDRYNGSYIMSAAAYNAGPTRVRQWVESFGDPRTSEIDPIDWVESIPFSETRNYVQRVMENMQVYRARLSGNRTDNRIVQALNAGAI